MEGVEGVDGVEGVEGVEGVDGVDAPVGPADHQALTGRNLEAQAIDQPVRHTILTQSELRHHDWPVAESGLTT